jgi:hypothetical protein
MRRPLVGGAVLCAALLLLQTAVPGLRAEEANRVYGIYGISKPGTNSLPLPIADCLGKPMDSFSGNDRNIAALARRFRDQPFDYVALTVPATQANAKAIGASLRPRPYPERLRWWAEGRFGPQRQDPLSPPLDLLQRLTQTAAHPGEGPAQPRPDRRQG